MQLLVKKNRRNTTKRHESEKKRIKINNKPPLFGQKSKKGPDFTCTIRWKICSNSKVRKMAKNEKTYSFLFCFRLPILGILFNIKINKIF